MILPSLGAVFLFSFVLGAMFRKISIWAPGAIIALPIAYFMFQTDDNLRYSHGIIDDLLSFFSTTGNTSNNLLCIITFAGGVGIWGVTSIGVAVGKGFGEYINNRRTKRRM